VVPGHPWTAPCLTAYRSTAGNPPAARRLQNPPMRIQLLSDLHLETEDFQPEPAPNADLLVLAGDIDGHWAGLSHFANWPVPVLMVAGNHEFDRRELRSSWPALRQRCECLGIDLLEQETRSLRCPRSGRLLRFLGTVRWCDFDLLGAHERERAMRAARYYLSVAATRLGERMLDAPAMRDEALACRDWLARTLVEPHQADATIVITHFAPSARSADPRYGLQPGSASFCNADDDLLPHAQLWIHGHLHCRHDYVVEHARGSTRVVSNARGHSGKGESEGHDPLFVLDV